MSACYCIGPQQGQPMCPCRMRSVEIRDGRYVQTIDHGPVNFVPPELSKLADDLWQRMREPLKQPDEF